MAVITELSPDSELFAKQMDEAASQRSTPVDTGDERDSAAAPHERRPRRSNQSDPRRLDRVTPYTNSTMDPVVDEALQDGPWVHMLALVLSTAGLMLQNRVVTWLALAVALWSVFNARRNDAGAAASLLPRYNGLGFAIAGLVATYLPAALELWAKWR